MRLHFMVYNDSILLTQLRIIRTSEAALFFWIAWQNIQQFQLNFDFSRLKLVEGLIAHVCTLNLGNTLGCSLTIGYILETV